MELIIKTRTEKIKGKLVQFAKFLCPNLLCNKIVERRIYNGLRDKSCGCTKYSEQVKQKIREARKLQNPPNKGRQFTEVHKEKIRQGKKGQISPMKGKHHTEETKQLMKEKHLGKFSELASNWQDGKSFEPYSPEFNKELKQTILERDNYTCQNLSCSGEFTRLDIHHIDYDKLNNNLENLTALCISCHMKTNFNRFYFTEYYQNIMINRLVEGLI